MKCNCTIWEGKKNNDFIKSFVKDMQHGASATLHKSTNELQRRPEQLICLLFYFFCVAVSFVDEVIINVETQLLIYDAV